MANQKETINYQLYLLDKQYKDSTNLINHINEAQDFYNGKHYNSPNISNSIRLTMNIIDKAVKTRASKIVGTPLYLTFTADDENVDCNKLRLFDEYNCNKLKLHAHNYQSVINSAINGTEITYMRWDEDDTTYKGIYKGGLVVEHIDIRNFAVANNYINSIQNQTWVMYWDDYPIQAVRDLVEGKTKKEKKAKLEAIIKEYSQDDDYRNRDVENDGKVRVFTRFFRINGEVHFTCETQYVSLFAYPHPLSRKLSTNIAKEIVDKYEREGDAYHEDNDDQQINDYEIDYENIAIQSRESKYYTDEQYHKFKEKFSLYPFAQFSETIVTRCFYGRSYVTNLIPIQKGINYELSMTLKAIENNAYNKIFAKPDALNGQEITNEPSQVITDYSRFTNGWGIKMAESQPIPNGLMEHAIGLINMTEQTYGFDKVMNGEIANQDISGYALSQMIKQSNTTIEQQQRLFWEYNIDLASIRLMFYKHYVDKARYSYEMDEATWNGEENARKFIYQALKNGKRFETRPDLTLDQVSKPVSRNKIGYFTNEDIYGINFDISIDAVQGLNDSKIVEQQLFDNLLLNGGIQNISPDVLELYLEASPNVSPRTKTALKRVLENIENSQLTQERQKTQELTMRVKQLVELCQSYEAKLGYTSEYAKNLQSEFTSKINNANKIITGLSTDLQKVKQSQQNSANGSGAKTQPVATQL